jgi:1-acyl-sn-glycerol-3-phosphate acyltransferase
MSTEIKYPRRVLIRGFLRVIVRALMPLLAKIEITGREHFPRQGPLIVVGNHSAAMEVVLMGVYSPWIIEFMGSIDIPHEKFIALVIDAYGFIPVFRGNVTPSSMKTGVDLLKQGGVLGIFPEGGIWEPAIRQAQSGVAWLSYHAQAPILPIGFGSMQGAIKEMFAFERPTLKMNVGAVLPPVQKRSGKSRKQHFQDEADRIMDAVWDLIPEQDRVQEEIIKNESFELQLQVRDQNNQAIPIPTDLMPQYGAAFAKFTHRKTLIDNLIENLNMTKAAPLRQLVDRPSLDEIIQATQAVLSYLEEHNPYYFTYRYGQTEGKAMEHGIREIHELARWAKARNLKLHITPLRRFTVIESGREVILDRPKEFAKW